jgi:hypothetical protein
MLRMRAFHRCCAACSCVVRARQFGRDGGGARTQAPGTPASPGTPAKPIPGDLKEKVQALFKSAKDGVIKATDFNGEFQKKYGAPHPPLRH